MKNNLPRYILLCLLNLSWVHARNRQQEAETLIKKSVDALYNILICSRNVSGCIEPAPSKPSPPALLTAAASLQPLHHTMPP